jgi:transposase-like protein
VDLTRFRGHCRSHESAVGVFHGQAQTTGIYKRVKAETVRLIRESGKSIAVVARELGLTESAVRVWVRQAGIDAGHGPVGALTTEEREELGRLRREVRTVRMERDILKKATAFFAKESE